MSEYTTSIQEICEKFSHMMTNEDYSNAQEIIDAARESIFNFEYPIFDSEYKNVLERKILMQYYLREIGFESYGKWKLKLQTVMNNIMPYYNQLYKSELIKINPLYTYNVERKRNNTGGDERSITENGTDSSTTNATTNRTNENTKTGNETADTTTKNTNENSRTGKDTKQYDKSRGETLQTEDTKSFNSERNSTANGSTSNNSEVKGNTSGTVGNQKTESLRDRYSDTPQGAISNLEDNTYLTNARLNDNTITDNGTSSSNSNQTETATGTNNNTSNDKVLESTNTRDKHVTTSQENNNEVFDYSTTDRGTNDTTNNATRDFSSTDKGTDNTISDSNISGTYQKSTTDTITTTRSYIENVAGNSSGMSESKLLMEFRDTFLNIDLMIINELNDLFMNVWGEECDCTWIM